MENKYSIGVSYLDPKSIIDAVDQYKVVTYFTKKQESSS